MAAFKNGPETIVISGKSYEVLEGVVGNSLTGAALCKCGEKSHARHPFCTVLPMPAGFEAAEKEGTIHRECTHRGWGSRGWKWVVSPR